MSIRRDPMRFVASGGRHVGPSRCDRGYARALHRIVMTRPVRTRDEAPRMLAALCFDEDALDETRIDLAVRDPAEDRVELVEPAVDELAQDHDGCRQLRGTQATLDGRARRDASRG